MPTDTNPDAVKVEHHGECPWCLAHPHREPCSPNCKAARDEREQRIRRADASSYFAPLGRYWRMGGDC